jgi:peptidoglycan/xylan/chitin deacetylase (PgdA/CDA1 family)
MRTEDSSTSSLAASARWLAAAGLGALALPALAIAGAPVHAKPPQIAVAGGIAVCAAAVATRGRRGRLLPITGILAAGVAAWLLAQASYPVAGWLIAPAVGVGAGLASGRPDPRGAAVASAVAAALIALRIAVGRDAAMAAGALAVAASGAISAMGAPGRPPPVWRAAGIGAAVLLLAGGTAAYVGATTPGATWFGALRHHGPRDSNMVAVTFDDGPDPPYTLQIRDILDAYGVKATFFTVGKALDARPDVSRALYDDGMLLGNHSYAHDAFRWLDPGYPELQRTQDAFERNLGVCPALYRPPHGSHTPFMAHVVADAGMTMVTWDVSAGDWATDDGALVAKRVLDKVRPGSIILLHDGIDGNIGADRGVILRALPAILDGLKSRGLEPVTLDRLLGVPGYLPAC